jgi:hemolysin III
MYAQLPTTEKANFLTHAIGLVFGLAAFPFLFFTENQGSLLGLAVFCFTFMLMFFTSSAYHLAITPDYKKRWRSADHISIYLLIAGTYTYFILTYLNTPKGHIILAVLWGGALIGAIFKLFFAGRFRLVSTLIYMGMGWAGIAAIGDFLREIPDPVLIWIAIGGASYSLGTIFYLWKKYTYHHAIWHLFVLGGALGHWWAIRLSMG